MEWVRSRTGVALALRSPRGLGNVESMPLIALLSDFGTRDGYVGIVKGTIAAIAPGIATVDLTHDLPPQNLWAARFCLANALPYFPAGTIFWAVVDPGVGGERRAIAVACERGYLVGPDNGIFDGVLARFPARAAVALDNPAYWRDPNPSTTFHGRDIFAPAAAHLAAGLPLAELGQPVPVDALVRLPLPPLVARETATGRAIAGIVQQVDRFGNLIASIPGDRVAGAQWQAMAGNPPATIPAGRTYGDRPLGSLVAIVGSHGWVEVACNGGSAAAMLGSTWGDRLEVEILESPAR